MSTPEFDTIERNELQCDFTSCERFYSTMYKHEMDIYVCRRILTIYIRRIYVGLFVSVCEFKCVCDVLYV